MKQDHFFSFGRLELTEDYGIITCVEGANIDFKEIEEIQDVLYPAYGRKRFGLIANRVNPYSVNPHAIGFVFLMNI